MSAAAAGTLNVTKDMVLSADATYDSVSVAANATLDLNGHRLATGSISGSGTVMSADFDSKPMSIDGYTLLDYVETPADNATAQVFVDTMYTPTCNDRVETMVELGSVSGNQSVFSARKDSAEKNFSCLTIGGKFRFDRYNKYGQANSGTVSAGGQYAITANFATSKYSLNGGAALATSGGTGDFTPYTNIFVFAMGTYGNGRYDIGYHAVSMKMQYFRVYDGAGALKVCMLPAKAPDGTVGFYDVARKTFLAPENGALTPSGSSYSALPYVQSPANNSSAQMSVIAGGYIPLLTDRIEAKFRLGRMSRGAEDLQGIFSARMSGATNTFSCVLSETSKLRFDHHTTAPHTYHTTGAVETGYTKLEDYEIAMDGSTLEFSVNGVVSDIPLTANPHDANATPGIELRLFGLATKGAGVGYFAEGCRIYNLSAYGKAGDLKLRLIPAKRRSDGTVGFYDVARCKFNGSAYGGNLTGGVSGNLATPGGRCQSSPSADTGSAANLFNGNFIYETDDISRFFLDMTLDAGKLPLRIDYDFGEGEEKVVNMYRIWGGGSGNGQRSPSEWEFYGSDTAYGSADETGWTLLDTGAKGSNLAGVASGSTANRCTRVFENKTAYRYYRMKITKGGTGVTWNNYLDFTQLEYFHVEATATPGELCIDVAAGAAATNRTATLGGDMKVSKSGEGSFVAAGPGAFYTGGTEVGAGAFIVGSPLSTAMKMESGATLGFLLQDDGDSPLLALEEGSSFPAGFRVIAEQASKDGDPGQEGRAVTYGYDFGGAAIDFAVSGGLSRRLTFDTAGNIVLRGRSGFIITVK